MTVPSHVLDSVLVAAQAAADKKGRNIVAFDVSEQLSITDVFLIASAGNERQVGAIVDGVEEALLKDRSRKPLRREGERDARWVLLDYGDIVVHVQHAEDRAFYALERLWRDAPALDLEVPDGRPEGESADPA